MSSTLGSQGVKETPFPTISDGTIGDAVVQTVNARDLHAFLGVGKQFGTWITDRVGQYAFNENIDFVVFPETGKNPSGGRPSKEYALTLDMAKELAMVERNEKGRQVRQYFIACERMVKEASAGAAVDYNRIGRLIAAIVADKVSTAADDIARTIVPQMVVAALAQHNLMVRCGKTAGQLLREAGFPPLKGLSPWFGNRMEKLGYCAEGEGRADHGDRAVRIFDPDRVRVWLREGGRDIVERKIATRRGQKVIHLVPPVSEAARTY